MPASRHLGCGVLAALALFAMSGPTSAFADDLAHIGELAKLPAPSKDDLAGRAGASPLQDDVLAPQTVHPHAQEGEASQQSGKADDERSKPKATQSESIVVVGQRPSEASSLLRSGLEPREVPWSVQVIPQSLLEEVRPEAIEDALTLVSNVVFQGNSDGRENAFLLRGFQAATVLRDGFRVESFGGITDPEIYNLQSIEVIKGPQAVLFGESNPGGLINLRTKRPLNRDHSEFVLDYGTDGLISTRTDFGGSIAGSNAARYRVIGVYKQDAGWRGYDAPNERFFVAPSVLWAISDNTAVTLIGELTKDDYQADFGTAIDLQGELTAPIGQVNNHPQDRIRRHQNIFGADIDHRFSDKWHVTARARHFDDGYAFSSLWLPISRNLATNIYTQLALQQEQQNNEDAIQLNVTGNLGVLGRHTDLAAGSDYRQTTTERITRLDATKLNFLNWAHPDYSRRPPDTESLPVAPGFRAGEDINRGGIFAKMRTELTHALSVNLGARYDRIERTPLTGSITTAQELSKTSLQAGAMYDLSKSVSVYASYSESFSPNFVLDRNNRLLAPEEGKGFDVGLKGSELGGLLTFTASVFDITKRNVALPDATAAPTDPNPLGFIAAAKQTSRGAEMDFQASMTPNWNLHGAFGYAETGDRGERIVGAPEQTASLWTSYRFAGGLRPLTVGGGLQHVGNRLAIADPNGDGNTRDRVFVDGYTLLDLFARYDLSERWRLQTNLSNATDERYVLTALNNLSRNVHAGAPLEARISLSYRLARADH